jgi:hypothetical protein
MKLSEWLAARLARNLYIDEWHREELVALQRKLAAQGE